MGSIIYNLYHVQEIHGTHDILEVEKDKQINEVTLPHPTEDSMRQEMINSSSDNDEESLQQ